MELPLLKRVTETGETFLLTTHRASACADSDCACAEPIVEGLIPLRVPGPGEQYRFHFDMTKCIGCKCCVVACNEQNGNPADINWRRVGDVEGGTYPYTQRHHLSMGCNHCLEPSCLIGCPVERIHQGIPATGVVMHSAEHCIGCQYCVWNCSYGVPQYNPERGVVGKCDMCHDRLRDGMAPACVDACPEGAIAHRDRERRANGARIISAPTRRDCRPPATASPPRALRLPENSSRDADQVDTQRDCSRSIRIGRWCSCWC